MSISRVVAITFTLLAALPVAAETVVATRTIRANSILTAGDLRVISDSIPGTLSDISQASGQEARTNLYAGRPIRLADIGPPAMIERNQVITLVYVVGGLKISTEGRALDRGGVGDRLRVMNLNSRNTVFGRIDDTGTVRVGH